MATGIHPPLSNLHLYPVCITGPTAVGKSEIALLLAEQLGGEIISVDSMQVYRGLDIGTAKPSPTDHSRAPHHLIDICDLTESFNAAQFSRLAHRSVAEIQSRGHVPILCGGTGLYFKAFLEGLDEMPSADAKLRAELEATPSEKLLEELRQKDPAAYAKIDTKNPRRVTRAVEVIRLTGRPFSEQKLEWNAAFLKAEVGKHGESPGVALHPPSSLFICLVRQPDDLRQQIHIRVDKMFRQGLVEETRELLKHGLGQNKTAMQAIGYRQVVEHLRGERNLPDTIELVKTRTRQFAKRQLTWFRAQKSLDWLELKPDESLDSVAANLIQAIKTRF